MTGSGPGWSAWGAGVLGSQRGGLDGWECRVPVGCPALGKQPQGERGGRGQLTQPRGWPCTLALHPTQSQELSVPCCPQPELAAGRPRPPGLKHSDLSTLCQASCSASPPASARRPGLTCFLRAQRGLMRQREMALPSASSPQTKPLL